MLLLGGIGGAIAGAAVSAGANELLSDDPKPPGKAGSKEQRAPVRNVGAQLTPGQNLVRRRRLNDDGTVDIVFERTLSQNKQEEIRARQQLMNRIILDIIRDSQGLPQQARAPAAQPAQTQQPQPVSSIAELAQSRGQQFIGPIGRG